MAQLDAMERTLKALADRTRLRILHLLGGGVVCVCHIHESLGLPQPNVSRHLAYVRRARLVAIRKDGLWVHYRHVVSTDPVLASIIGAVTHCTAHVAQTGHDSRRLERIAGCCADVPEAPNPGLARRRAERHHGRTTKRRETP